MITDMLYKIFRKMLNILFNLLFLIFNKLMLKIRKRLEKPMFESHRPGMAILLFLILAIIYFIFENVASLQVIFMITTCVYLFGFFVYVWLITKLNNSRIEKSK